MNKLWFRSIIGAFCFTIMCMIFSSAIEAKAVDYSISQYTINADVQPDGGVDITEFLTYSFDGSANGIYRDIDYVNPKNALSSASGIDEIKVYEAGISDDTLQEYLKDNTGTSKSGSYETINRENGVRLKIYCPADNEEKRFLIQYHLKDAVVKYSDTADFYWKFIGDGWETQLNNVSIVVTVPETDSSFKAFSHGPLNGKIRLDDNSSVEYVNSSIDAGDEVSIRVLFSPNMLLSCTKNPATPKLKALLAEEKQWAIAANKKRLTTIISVSMALGWFVLCIAIYIVLYRKYGRREKTYFETATKPPSDYGPAFTEYITSYSTLGPKGITAELMNLVRKKYIQINESADIILAKSKQPDLAVTVNPLHTSCEFAHEQFLMDWFINKIGDGKTVTLNEIKTYSKKHSSEFNKTFTEFKKLIKKEAEQMNLVSEKTTAWKPALLFCIFGIGSGIILAVSNQMYEYLVSATVSSLLLIFMAIFIKRPTVELAQEKEKWQSYRMHLKEIVKNPEAGSQNPTSNYDLIYWEQALIFTIVFGTHKNALKKLQTGFTDIDFLDPNLTYLHSTHGSTNAIGHFSSTVDSSITNFSSTSGFSGGSSGAAGAGGGGGGGGGAF